MLSEQSDLPLWPPRRRRHRTDMLWLERLERVGLSPFRDTFPSPPPTSLYKAIDQFNAGLFWECHETLEELWLVTPYPLRHFYQGILKIAVGLHHASRHNARGCRNKLSEGLRLVNAFTPSFLGLNTESLAQDVECWLETLGHQGRVDWPRLDTLARPRIRSSPVN